MTPPTLTIVAERPGHAAAIDRVHELAFPTDAEARLVSALRRSGRLVVSLAALRGTEVVGHVAFSPIRVGDFEAGVGLAPLAVVPEHQRQGIGAALVRSGLEACRSGGVGFVVVLGDPTYYARFGFVAAVRWNLSDSFGGGPAFQALELRPGAIPVAGGLVRYAPEFSSLGE